DAERLRIAERLHAERWLRVRQPSPEGSKEPVPDGQDRSVVGIRVLSRWCVVDPVHRGRHEGPPKTGLEASGDPYVGVLELRIGQHDGLEDDEPLRRDAYEEDDSDLEDRGDENL